MSKNIKIKSIVTALIFIGYILNVFFAYKILQSTNVITLWNKVIAGSFITVITANFCMTVYCGIELRKNMNKKDLTLFMLNKVMFLCIVILFLIGYFIWKNQV